MLYQSIQDDFCYDVAHQQLSECIYSAQTLEQLVASVRVFFQTSFQPSFLEVVTESTHHRVSREVLTHLRNAWQYASPLEPLFPGIMHGPSIFIAVPLVVHPLRCVGWVLLGKKRYGGSYSKHELRFLQSATYQLAQAMRGYFTQSRAESGIRRSDLLSVAAHELRTPMTAVKSYIWLSLFRSKKDLPKQVAEHLRLAYEATDRLLGLIKDLLTTSQIEADAVRLCLCETSLTALTRQVVDQLSIHAKAKQLRFIWQGFDDEQLLLLDAHKLAEVIQNVVSNAIRFAPEKSAIYMSMQEEKASVALAVKDSGRGISARDQHLLFHKFGGKQDALTKLPEQEHGLGLYIAQEFTRLHGGHIHVTSELGKGTTFTIHLPKSKELISNAPHLYLTH